MRSVFIAVLLIAFGLQAQEPKTPAETVLAPPADLYSSYRIMPGDIVDVRFFYNPELDEKDVIVRPDGYVALQLVGDVKLASKTPEEARKSIEQMFAQQVRMPSVTIQIRKYASNKVYVVGEVPKPGLIGLEGPLSLVNAIGEAGGITIKGNRNKVILVRKMPDGTAAKRSVKLFAHGQTTTEALAVLQPFDVILVPESSIARADRWVDQWVKGLSPANLTAGFEYLKEPTQSIPVF